MGKRLLTMKAFATWLLSKPDNEIVGQSCSNCACPIANFLAQAAGVERRVYSVTHIRYHRIRENDTSRRRDKSHLLPVWARIFIQRIDYDPGVISVSAANARVTLSNIARRLR